MKKEVLKMKIKKKNNQKKERRTLPAETETQSTAVRCFIHHFRFIFMLSGSCGV